MVWRETGNSSLGASFHSLLLLSPSQPGLSVQVPAEVNESRLSVRRVQGSQIVSIAERQSWRERLGNRCLSFNYI